MRRPKERRRDRTYLHFLKLCYCANEVICLPSQSCICQIDNTFCSEQNRLIQQAGVSIVYDGDGNRVRKTVAGVTTTYLVDTLNPTGYAQVLYETAQGPGVNSDNRAYVYGLERISQQRSFFLNFQNGTQTSYYVYDGHGSVRALADPTGAATDSYDYDAFGNLIHSTGSTPNNYLYSGEQYDPDLHLYYNRARYLNVSAGRFLSTDTFEGYNNEPVSLHRYLFAGGDPVNRLDPSGDDFIDTLGAAAISIGTLASQAALVVTTVLGTVYINLYRVPQVIEAASNYATIGVGAFETLRFLGSNALRYAESYSQVPTQRGLDYETATQANLGKFFPGLDHFDKGSGVGVQVRTTTQTQTMEALLAVVNKGVNRLNSLPDELTRPIY
jgi:RHS repeat-associated protein